MSFGSAANRAAAFSDAIGIVRCSLRDLLTLLPRPGSTQTRPLRRRPALGVIACLFLAAGIVASAHAQPASTADLALLDGQQFSGTVGAMGKDEPYNNDSIVFADGHFVSTDCVQYGFARVPYTARRDGDVIHFDAVTTSPSHGTMTWRGTIRGDEARATYQWVRERWLWTQRGEYWFKGRRDGGTR